MAVEFLTEDQEWPIDLPPEPNRDRYVVVRNADGSAHEQVFRYSDGKSLWIGYGTFGYGSPWAYLVYWAMTQGLTLAARSIPAETGDGQ
jgi:hypothetical protein